MWILSSSRAERSGVEGLRGASFVWQRGPSASLGMTVLREPIGIKLVINFATMHFHFAQARWHFQR